MARTARPGGSRGVLRGFVVTLAVLLAAGATAATVLTDDPQRLRLAVVAALWAFILLALAAPRRRTEAAPVAGVGEDELRRAYEVELEREVAARREYELQLEVYLRRELEQGLAEDVQALRDEVARVRAEVLAQLEDPGPRTDAVPAPAPYSPFPSYAEPPPYVPPPPPRPGPLDEYLRAAVPAEPVPGDLPARRADLPPYGPPPSPRPPQNGEAVPHRRRARSDAEANEVLSRLLGR